MRILHTIDSAGLYGAEAVLLTLASEQLRRSQEPIILSIGNRAGGEKPLEAEARRRGLACIPLRMADGLTLTGIRAILAIAERERIDVIHSHGYKTDILMACVPGFMRRRAVVATLHGWTAKKTWSKLGLYRYLDRLALGQMDFVVPVSRGMLEIDAIRALPPGRVRAIPNGIVVDQPDSIDALSGDSLAHSLRELRARTSLLVGAVGRLSPEKNFGALISAVATKTSRLRDVGVAILGDGPEAPALRSLAEMHELSTNVLLAGYTSNARRYLGLFDLLVIPSLTEGLPIILLEAMSAGLPVIASRVGDIPTVIGEFGLLIEPGDDLALATAIEWIRDDLSAYQAKSKLAAKWIAQEYSAATMAMRYDEVYRMARLSTR